MPSKVKKRIKRKRRWGLTTDRQVRFVEEYVIDKNATQAALRAGYSKKTAGVIGNENLKKPEIAAAIKVLLGKMAEESGISAERVLKEYAKIAFAEMSDFANWNGKTIKLKDSKELTSEQRAAVAEVTQTQSGLKVKLHDKKGALDSLARHLGLFVDKIQINLSNMTDEEIIAAMQKAVSE